jgi:hypothetical protein
MPGGGFGGLPSGISKEDMAKMAKMSPAEMNRYIAALMKQQGGGGDEDDGMPSLEVRGLFARARAHPRRPFFFARSTLTPHSPPPFSRSRAQGADFQGAAAEEDDEDDDGPPPLDGAQ